MDEVDGVVVRAEAETVDEVGDVMDCVAIQESIGGVGDSRAETAIVDDECEVGNITSGIKSEVGDITVDTAVGVGDSRAETAIDDGKCEVDNVTPGNVGDIPVDTTVGEDNSGVAGTTADAAAGKGEVNDITKGTVDATVDETAGVVDETAAGAAEDCNGEVSDVTTGTVVDEDGENVGVAADAADVGIVEGDAALNGNCDCFSFL